MKIQVFYDEGMSSWLRWQSFDLINFYHNTGWGDETKRSGVY